MMFASAEMISRDLAVQIVDGVHGYTMEFAPSMRAHRDEYEHWDRVILEAIRGLVAPDWRSIDEAPRDGMAFLAGGIHDRDDPAGAERGVRVGDQWCAILVWDIWRQGPEEGDRWVFSKDGTPPWSKPQWYRPLLPLPVPPSGG